MKNQREILFRGKGENGRWIYGNALLPERNTHGHYTESSISFTFASGYGFQSFEIDPETLGQYTGLKDKDGVKIFEGDVVNFHTFYYDSGNTADWFGVEPQNSRFIEEFYIADHKGIVSFQDGTFGLRYEKDIFRTLHSILAKRDFSEGFYEWDRMIKEVIDEDDRIESIEDFEKLLSSLSVIGNIHDNPKLLKS